jgi:hypothetical protein
VYWLQPDGTIKRSTPANFGVIGNGHHIKLSNNPNESSPWDESFEKEFQKADGNFPEVIDWLDDLDRVDPPFDRPIASRIIPQPTTDENFAKLIECLASLAVRSPMHREGGVRGAEYLRGEIAAREQHALIGLNIRHSLRNAVRQIGGRGKAMVIFSPEREFLFGDGFFNNLTPPVDHLLFPKMLVPLTPWMAVLFAQPTKYSTDPRLVTLVISPNETDEINHAVHVYASDALFYRAEQPVVTDAFAIGRHQIFQDDHNSVDALIHQIPGVPPRDTSLDWLLDRMRRG